MASILGILREGPATKTRIVYSANLNFERAEKYLELMKGLGLVEEVVDDDGRRVFRATEKGGAFLEDLEKLMERSPRAKRSQADSSSLRNLRTSSESFTRFSLSS
jgi:predicted transcriptional regulator